MIHESYFLPRVSEVVFEAERKAVLGDKYEYFYKSFAVMEKNNPLLHDYLNQVRKFPDWADHVTLVVFIYMVLHKQGEADASNKTTGMFDDNSSCILN